jgi:hypothetical protein
VQLHVRFRGGQTTTIEVPLPLSACELRATPADIVAALNELLGSHTDAEAAEALNSRATAPARDSPSPARRDSLLGQLPISLGWSQLTPGLSTGIPSPDAIAAILSS